MSFYVNIIPKETHLIASNSR